LSDGAIVALLVAIARPDLMRKVVAMGPDFILDFLANDPIETTVPIRRAQVTAAG